MFLKLDPSKQKRILDAAYEEFSMHSFKTASTNRIVKRAGIGKGMLFYYFKSKDELFVYLVQEGLELIRTHYYAKVDEKETDLLERLKQMGEYKIEIYEMHPHRLSFLSRLILHEDRLLIPEKLQAEIIEMSQQAQKNLFKNIDQSKFRKDLPAGFVFKMLLWSIEGYQQSVIQKIKSQDITDGEEILNPAYQRPDWDEFYDYLDALKKVYYE